jgi:hypothetical protein
MFLVPFLARQRVGQQPIRLLDLQKALAIATLLVRVKALGQLAVGSFDLGLGCVSSDSEGAIWVEGLSHQSGAC